LTSLEVKKSVRDFPGSSWDLLARRATFYNSRWWLEYAERTTDAWTAYLALREGDEWVAVIPAWLHHPGGNPMFEPNRLLPDMGLPEISYLVVGPQKAYNCELLSLSYEGLSASAVSTLVEGVRSVAKSHNAHPIALYAGTETVRALQQYLPGRTPILLNADAAITIPGSFQEYLQGLPSKRRTNIRREISKFSKQGYAVEFLPLSECYEEVAPLVVNLQNRYGDPVTIEAMTSYLRLQAELYDHKTVVVTARISGALRAACVLYESPDGLAARMVGFDYENLLNAFEYYNLCVYLPLEYGMRKGHKCLQLGVAAAGAKAARGAVLEPLYAFDLGVSPLWSEDAARAWNGAAVEQFSAEVVVTPSALTNSRWQGVPV
jgi:uncharacterized protein